MSVSAGKRRRPLVVTVVITLSAIGALSTIGGGRFALRGAKMAAERGADVPPALVPELISGMVLSVIILLVAPFLWKGFRWAHVAFLVLLALNLLMILRAAIIGGFIATHVFFLGEPLLLIVLLLTPAARDYCTR
ncbi:MAG: hypothetical protein U9R79_11635 [Armatimonadota bacterium]|nr:hypothetical protein [Armatimonadota bacterium]